MRVAVRTRSGWVVVLVGTSVGERRVATDLKECAAELLQQGDVVRREERFALLTRWRLR